MTGTSHTVHAGDSLLALADIAPGTFDAVITDPPYSSGGMFRSDRGGSAKEKYLESGSAALDRLPDFYGDNRTERALLLWSTLWLGECWRVTRDGGAIAVFCDWRSLPVFSDALQAGGWTWRGIGVWIKPPGKSRPVMGGLWNDTEYVLWGSRGARSGDHLECLPGTWRCVAPASASRLHPTEKPQEVLRDLVRLAPPGGHILDPFAGSGAIAVATSMTGRSSTSIELSEEYAAIIRRRIAELGRYGADVTRVGGARTLFEDDAA